MIQRGRFRDGPKARAATDESVHSDGTTQDGMTQDGMIQINDSDDGLWQRRCSVYTNFPRSFSAFFLKARHFVIRSRKDFYYENCVKIMCFS